MRSELSTYLAEPVESAQTGQSPRPFDCLSLAPLFAIHFDAELFRAYLEKTRGGSQDSNAALGVQALPVLGHLEWLGDDYRPLAGKLCRQAGDGRFCEAL